MLAFGLNTINYRSPIKFLEKDMSCQPWSLKAIEDNNIEEKRIDIGLDNNIITKSQDTLLELPAGCAEDKIPASSVNMEETRATNNRNNNSIVITHRDTSTDNDDMPTDAKNKSRYLCFVCGKTFTKNADLKVHNMVHTGDMPYKCELCGRGFPVKYKRMIHMRSHTNEKPFTCDICGKTFRLNNFRVKHMKKMHPGADFVEHRCSVCGKSFTNANLRIAHEKTNCGTTRAPSSRKLPVAKTGAGLFDDADSLPIPSASDPKPTKKIPANVTAEDLERIRLGDKKPYVCSICNKGFTRSSNRQIHMQKHSDNKTPFECLTCGQRFTQICSLQDHSERIHNNRKPYQCTICLKGFLSDCSRLRHERSHETSGEQHRCTTCDATFSSLNGLISHLSVHDIKKAQVCSICGATFKTASICKRHEQTHNKPYHCGVCGKGFNFDDTRERHERGHMLLKPSASGPESDSSAAIECITCHEIFQSKAELECHLPTHSEGRPHVCSVCGRGFWIPRHLKMHQATHCSEKPFVCALCGISFKNYDYKEMHEKYHHSNEAWTPHKCSVCGLGFTNTGERNRHEALHNSDTPHQCPTCGLGFQQSSTLEDHEKCHKEGFCQCSDCGQAFSNISDRARHCEEIHGKVIASESDLSKVYPANIFEGHKCALCDKVLPTLRHLGRHKKSVHAEKTHVCTFCGKTFARKQGLKNHLPKHSDEKKHHCSVCGKGFKSDRSRKGHEMTQHSGPPRRPISPQQGPFYCSVCGKRFDKKHKWRSHEALQHNERPYKCYVCDKTFLTSDLVAKHLKTHEGDATVAVVKTECDL